MRCPEPKAATALCLTQSAPWAQVLCPSVSTPTAGRPQLPPAARRLSSAARERPLLPSACGCSPAPAVGACRPPGAENNDLYLGPAQYAHTVRRATRLSPPQGPWHDRGSASGI